MSSRGWDRGRVAVLASGNGSNLQALIDDQRVRPALVRVIVNNATAGAKARAERAGIPTRLIDHRTFDDRDAFDRALAKALLDDRVEWVVLAGFMRILGAAMVSAFGGRIVNIHPALLPSFPGLHPQKQALAAGVKIAGCTVHLVDAGTDTGPILAQAAVPVLPGDDEATLSARILRVEHRLLPAVVVSLLTTGLVEDANGRPHLAAPLPIAELPPGGPEGWLASPL